MSGNGARTALAAAGAGAVEVVAEALSFRSPRMRSIMSIARSMAAMGMLTVREGCAGADGGNLLGEVVYSHDS